MAAWLTAPVQLEGSREFMCDPLTTEQCEWYMERWHFWYIADWVYALPTVAFFMCAIGIFIIGHVMSSLVLGYRRFKEPPIWRQLIAGVRYLSYRGFYVKSLRWSSPPLGVLLLGLAGTLFFFLMVLAPGTYYWSSELYGNSPALATRSGWMALACMPFVFATATKTNWITLLTGVSHEKLQVFHRWIAYAFFILSLLHTFPFIVFHIRSHDMEYHFSSNLLFYWTGIVAIIFQAWLSFASHSTIRNLGYEFFKMSHFVSAVVFILMLFWHCDYTLTSWDYFIGTAAVYVPSYVYPWLRTCFEYGGSQKAQIFIEDSGFIRITIPAKFNWKPGQHCFLRFTSFGLLGTLSSHPFTICSLPPTRQDEPELVFYLRHQGGLTAKLYQYALDKLGAPVPVLVDGPYGGINLQKYHDNEQLLVIAGGSGAGWCLPFIERFVRGLLLGDEEKGQLIATDGNATSSTESLRRGNHSGPLSLRVILATRDISSRIWFLRTVSELLSRYPATASSHVQVQVFVTGEAAEKLDLSSQGSEEPASSKEPSRPTGKGDTIRIKGGGHEAVVPGKEYKGRPQLPLIVREEGAKVVEAGQSLGVFVCGPTTMLNDVRNSVAEANLKRLRGSKSGGVYLHSEHFSWA